MCLVKKEGARAGDHCVALLYSSNNVSHRGKKKKKEGAVGIHTFERAKPLRGAVFYSL